MRKTKAEKGITLVALIITIIVLLILAVVAINAVRDDGIIDYAKNARNEYEKAQSEESTTLGYYTNKIKESTEEVKKIYFKIENELFYAEEGMTWEEWVNSKYNTIGAVLDKDSEEEEIFIKLILNGIEGYVVIWNYEKGSIGIGENVVKQQKIKDFSKNTDEQYVKYEIIDHVWSD